MYEERVTDDISRSAEDARMPVWKKECIVVGNIQGSCFKYKKKMSAAVIGLQKCFCFVLVAYERVF